MFTAAAQLCVKACFEEATAAADDQQRGGFLAKAHEHAARVRQAQLSKRTLRRKVRAAYRQVRLRRSGGANKCSTRHAAWPRLAWAPCSSLCCVKSAVEVLTPTIASVDSGLLRPVALACCCCCLLLSLLLLGPLPVAVCLLSCCWLPVSLNTCAVPLSLVTATQLGVSPWLKARL